MKLILILSCLFLTSCSDYTEDEKSFILKLSQAGQVAQILKGSFEFVSIGIFILCLTLCDGIKIKTKVKIDKVEYEGDSNE